MVMAVILLLALALVLGCYCALHRQKLAEIYLRPLLKDTHLLKDIDSPFNFLYIYYF